MGFSMGRPLSPPILGNRRAMPSNGEWAVLKILWREIPRGKYPATLSYYMTFTMPPRGLRFKEAFFAILKYGRGVWINEPNLERNWQN